MTPQEMKEAELEFVLMVQAEHPIELTLRRETALAVVASLQLALRHPGIQGMPTAAIARRFVDMLIRATSTSTDGLYTYQRVRAMLEAGDNPEHDV